MGVGTGYGVRGGAEQKPLVAARLGAGHVEPSLRCRWRRGSGVDHRAVHGAVLHADRRDSGCAGGRRVRVRAVDAGRLDGRPASCGNRSDGRRSHLDRGAVIPERCRTARRSRCCTAWPAGGWRLGVTGGRWHRLRLHRPGHPAAGRAAHARGRLMSVPVGLPAGLGLGLGSSGRPRRVESRTPVDRPARPRRTLREVPWRVCGVTAALSAVAFGERALADAAGSVLAARLPAEAGWGGRPGMRSPWVV